MAHDVGALAPGHRRLKELRRLINDRAARKDAGLFVVEGPVLTSEALNSDLKVREVFAEERIFKSGKHGLLFGAIREEGATYTDVVNGALEKVLSTRTPQPMAALVEWPEFHDPADLLDADGVAKGLPILGLIDIADPGNMGTILRTAEAAGFGGAIIAGSSVDVTNSKVVRASAGAVFRLLMAVEGDLVALRKDCDNTERAILNTVLERGAKPYESCALGDAFICFGNEAHGLSTDWLNAVGAPITIRLAGPTESLNVAASAAIIGFESLRQRREKTGQTP